MKKFITSDSIKDYLNKGVVKFSYEKKDGSWRNAIGTRNSELIEFVDGVIPSGRGKEKQGVISYWDLDINEWRCFLTDSLIDANEYMSVEKYKLLIKNEDDEK